jgi:hypothetical protein
LELHGIPSYVSEKSEVLLRVVNTGTGVYRGTPVVIFPRSNY